MPKHGSRGFTLLEAVAALAILGLAGVAALEAIGGELRTADRARTAAIESALAQDRLAVLTLLPLRELQPLADSVAGGTFPGPFEDYEWTATVRPRFGERDLYDVTVEVFNQTTRYDIATRLYRAAVAEATP
jgi:prepilin-type N-terminal cleavage/methylation domain-containing protein